MNVIQLAIFYITNCRFQFIWLEPYLLFTHTCKWECLNNNERTRRKKQILISRCVNQYSQNPFMLIYVSYSALFHKSLVPRPHFIRTKISFSTNMLTIMVLYRKSNVSPDIFRSIVRPTLQNIHTHVIVGFQSHTIEWSYIGSCIH